MLEYKMSKFLFICLVLLAACGLRDNISDDTSPVPHTADSLNAKLYHNTNGRTPKIVLITLDGVRWQDIFDGETPSPYPKQYTSRQLVPNLYHSFVDNGIAIGKYSQARNKNNRHISQPGYLELLTGIPSTTCFTNHCPYNTKPTLVNEFNSSAVFASWDIIDHIVDNSGIVNTGRYIRNDKWKQLHLSDNQDFEQEFDDNYRPDVLTYTATIDYLKTTQPDFLWVSFCDRDDWAHYNNVVFYWASLNAADYYISEIMKLTDPNTVFIITTDHGRGGGDGWNNHGTDAASGRVWILIAGAGIPRVGFVSYDRVVYSSDIYPTIMEITKSQKSPRSLLNSL